jgi:NhaP-type Na+/H+ or K+/H+ antiporter
MPLSKMTTFLFGLLIGFAFGYPMGLFIDYLDKKEKRKQRVDAAIQKVMEEDGEILGRMID